VNTTADVKRKRATPMAPDERRRAIIDAVVPLLTQHGPDVTTKQIAEAAGIAEGTIFRVFPDKRALLWATAEETINPSGGREHMAATLAGVPDLRGKIVATVEQIVARTEKVLVVMMALRSALMAEGGRDFKPPIGPPPFIVEANEALVKNLTDFVFKPHRTELRVAPAKAAVLLRSVVFGATHPGMWHTARLLSPQDIADALLHGVVSSEATDVKGRR
jgi:AcrR family transcriptional regulator